MNKKIVKSSGNIFKDIGVSDSEHTLIRSQVMTQIIEIIKEHGFSQIKTGKILNLAQSKVSNLMNGKLSVFSLEHLFKLLTVLQWNTLAIYINNLVFQGKIEELDMIYQNSDKSRSLVRNGKPTQLVFIDINKLVERKTELVKELK